VLPIFATAFEGAFNRALPHSSPTVRRVSTDCLPRSRSQIEEKMFIPSVAVWELILRAAIIYVFVFVLLRMLGKKHVGEMAPFDLVILLILSEAVQNALVADEKSVTGGLVVAGTLFGISQLIGYVTWKNKRAERFLEGAPRVLVRHGTIDRAAMAEEQITHAELLEALRQEGCTTLTKVRYAVLENDGAITIGLRSDKGSRTGKA
jgi:uncharacterized membrane protein YcaP (DUF421 family)